MLTRVWKVVLVAGMLSCAVFVSANPSEGSSQKVGGHSGHTHHHHGDHAQMMSASKPHTYLRGALKISNVWIREAHPNASVNAGYLVLSNEGESLLQITAATCDAFENVEFHEMAMVGGMMEMREIDGLHIARGKRLVLEPGGKHLMLKGPKRRLKEGDFVDLVLTFQSGETVSITMPVRKGF